MTPARRMTCRAKKDGDWSARRRQWRGRHSRPLPSVIPGLTGNPLSLSIHPAGNAMAGAPSPLHFGGLRCAAAALWCSGSEANAQTRLRLRHARLTPSTAQPRRPALLGAKEARRQRPSHGIARIACTCHGLKPSTRYPWHRGYHWCGAWFQGKIYTDPFVQSSDMTPAPIYLSLEVHEKSNPQPPE